MAKYKYIFKKDLKKITYVKLWIPRKWWRETLKALKLRPIERCLLISLTLWGDYRPSTRVLARELGVKWETAKKGRENLKKLGFYSYPKSDN
jgi:hypothetical protein